MQIQADLLQRPVLRPKMAETTALGAACLAGLAAKFWNDPAQLDAHFQVDRVFEPTGVPDQIAATRARWRQAVQHAKNWERPQ